MKEIFNKIITENIWKINGIDTACGPGSTIEYTESLRSNLVKLIQKHNFTSMLDAPCGDYKWMSLVNFPNDFNYYGADVSDIVINQNKELYPNIDFSIIDITKDQLPKVDFMLCRDCLIHLSFADIDNFFKNFLQSEINFLLLTNHRKSKFNFKDIKTGDCRPINFTVAPYNFSQPLDYIDDTFSNFIERDLCLWTRDSIKKYLEDKKIWKI